MVRTWSWLKAWSAGCGVPGRAQLSLRLQEESKRDPGCGRPCPEVLHLLDWVLTFVCRGSLGTGQESFSPHSGHLCLVLE